MKFVVSTCGTSVLTQYSPEETRRLVYRYANFSEDQIPADVLQTFQDVIDQRRKRLLEAPLDEVRKLSAELNGIIALYGNDFPRAARGDRQMLVTTDTYLGRAAAETVAEWLRNHGVPVDDVYAISDLVTDPYERFLDGVQQLVEWCETYLAESRVRYRIVFNLTGGFKAVQGIMNTLAHVYADEAVYIFETGRHLIHIPALPVKLDPVGTVRPHLKILRRMAVLGQVPVNEVSDVPQSLVMAIDDQASLSLIGEIVWRKAAPELYRERLLDPVSPKIRYTSRFLNDVKAVHDPSRIAQLNQRIDDLEQFLRNPQSRARDRAKVKSVHEHPTLPQVTHECYAWSDGAAYRIFFHRENGEIVLDALGPHL